MPERLVLVRDFAIIMAVAGGALVLFRQLKQPPVLGYLVAGFILGPFVLPGFSVQHTESIRRLADLGLILLLFGIGLEFGWQRIRRVGLQVLFIGAAETLFMLALGYQVGRFLGWSSTDSFFLGAAISISSSTVLFKMLRDTGRLQQREGRLIVGILVVEDFIAVILLALLSGYATAGVASPADVGSLAGRLALFTVSSLVLGGLLAPRLINFVAKFKSQETLLIVGLALCFGLALVAEQLGVSAAAGAFLIGTVLGDSEHSEEIGRTMAPVRDMFGAIFFVSIGMLADLSLFGKFIGPALVVTLVFVGGKILANTIATFMAGHDARTAVRVGTGMPQLGEFSLAMVKVGADHSVVGAFLYPVIAVTTPPPPLSIRWCSVPQTQSQASWTGRRRRW